MRAEQEPEPIAWLVLVLFRATSKSSRSPEICNRLWRARVLEGYTPDPQDEKWVRETWRHPSPEVLKAQG